MVILFFINMDEDYELSRDLIVDLYNFISATISNVWAMDYLEYVDWIISATKFPKDIIRNWTAPSPAEFGQPDKPILLCGCDKKP